MGARETPRSLSEGKCDNPWKGLFCGERRAFLWYHRAVPPVSGAFWAQNGANFLRARREGRRRSNGTSTPLQYAGIDVRLNWYHTKRKVAQPCHPVGYGRGGTCYQFDFKVRLGSELRDVIWWQRLIVEPIGLKKIDAKATGIWLLKRTQCLINT